MGQTLIKTKVISTQVVIISTTHAVAQVFTCQTLRRTSRADSTFIFVLVVAIYWSAPFGYVINFSEISSFVTGEAIDTVVASVAVVGAG